jgi:hypothetical protein
MALATSNLATIQQKVRRVTRSPSTAQLTDDDLNQYINTFIINDIPNSIRLFSLRTVLTFYTQPGVDVYSTNTTNPLDPLYNFQNKYISIHAPVFIAGVPAFFTQLRNVFYGNWPQTNTVAQTGYQGNGTPGPFAGTIPSFQQAPVVNQPFTNSFPYILQNSVLFTALDTNFNAMQIIDYPVSNTTGALGIPGSPQTLPSPYGDINYQTGAYSVVFPNNTALASGTINNPIWAEYIAYAAGLPTTMLYYNNQFTLRPVPDKSYVIQVEADIQPTQLLETTDIPNIAQWWQYIALGASIRILQDRLDYDSVNLIMPEFYNQQSMVLSTTMEQYTNQRTETIYSNNGITNAWNNFGRWPY